MTGNQTIAIPSDCNGITIRLDVTGAGTTVNETVTLSMRENISTSSGGNHIAKMLSVGSSFMTGSIWPAGVFSHLCSFDDSPYGNVAIELGIGQENVNHILMSSTGLLYDAGNGSILTKIKNTDLTNYDYILTEYNTPDIENFSLGTLSSTAGDGTLVGAVLELLAYMKTSNANATLILVGAPPSSPAAGHTGSTVFSGNWAKGYSIADADLMLHRLAVREHFIFIDWEDLNLSYYYRDFCYGTNLHPETDATCRAMGLYLARCCNYTTSLARVLKADM